jgi:hypothetical protein
VTTLAKSNLNDRQESRTDNTGLAKVAVTCSADTFVDEKSPRRHDFEKQNINFWELMTDTRVQFDKETKQWYSYKSNETLKKKL